MKYGISPRCDETPSSVELRGLETSSPRASARSGLVAAVKAYELMTVEAALHGDRDAGYRALLAYPLGARVDKVQAVLDDMLKTHREYLPRSGTDLTAERPDRLPSC